MDDYRYTQPDSRRFDRTIPGTPPVFRTKNLARGIAAITTAIGLTVLLGWMSGISVTKTLLPENTAMTANVAVCFIFLGLALHRCSDHRGDGSAADRRVPRLSGILLSGFVLAAGVLAIGGPVPTSDAYGNLFSANGNPITHSPFTETMAHGTAIGLVLAATSLLTSHGRNRPLIAASQFTAALLMAGAFLGIAGCLYGGDAFHHSYVYSNAALPTMMLFFLLATGIVLSTTEQEWVAEFHRTTPNSLMTKRLIVIMVVALMAIGWMILKVQTATLPDVYIDVAAMVPAGIAITTAALWAAMRNSNLASEKRDELSGICAMLASTHEAIARSSARDEMLAAVCRVAVEQGGFPFVAIGLFDQVSGEIRPAAHAGKSLRAYCEPLRRQDGLDQCLTAPLQNAVLTKREVIFGGQSDGARESPVTGYGQAQGTLSGVAFPITENGKVVGAMAFCSSERKRPDPALVDVLRGVAGNVSIALDNFDREEDRAKSMAMLEISAQVVDASPVVLMRWLPEGNWPIVYISQNVARFGFDVSEFITMDREFQDLMHPGDRELFGNALEAARKNELGEFRQRFRLMKRDGAPVWIEAYTKIIQGESGELVYCQGLLTDITDRHETETRIEHLATHDFLTGLPNRQMMQARLEQAVDHAARNNTHIAVLYLDLDRFKLANDRWGHECGDTLLKDVATRIVGKARSEDTVVRPGGDEFLILMTDVRDVVEVFMASHELVAAFETPFSLLGRELVVTASLGVSVFPTDGRDPDTLVRYADIAMHRAKYDGGNTFRFYADSMSEEINRRVDIESNIRKALKANEFCLVYQPKIWANSNEISGIEALIRWNRPGGGMISPAEFIPVAEESDLIVSIGEWVVREACLQCRAWLDSGLPGVTVAVNISGRHFHRPELVEFIDQTLADTGLPAKYLELELTESALVHDLDTIVRIMNALNEMGVHVSIDDFGTGYSSLSRLKGLPIQNLKLDKSFVDGVPDEPDSVAISKAIITLGRTLGLKVTAEGVETAAQLKFLQSEGCDEIQGYWFSKPVTATEMAGMLLEQEAAIPEV